MSFEIGDAQIVHETEDSLFIEAPKFGGDSVCIPMRQVWFSESDAKKVGDVGTIVVSDWLAKKRGWV